MILKKKTNPVWPILISALIVAAVFATIFEGVDALFRYKRSVQPSLEPNLTSLHYFIKEEITRKVQAITAKNPDKETQLSSIYLYTSEDNLASLNSDLPSSGKTQTVAGHIKDDQDQLSSDATFRYRGGLPIHWLHKKKSFRVNLPPYTTYNGARKFNLVTPTTIETITDWVSNQISQDIGIITPEIKPVRLYVNDEYRGLHFYLDQVDESLLRKHHRMPGSIYSGDTLYIPNPFGPDKDGANEIAFFDDSGMPMLWRDQRLWQKDASRNAEKNDDRRDIHQFIDTINSQDLLDFRQKFEKHFDKEKFYKYWALDSLLGVYHHDYFHNHKLYFDPYKGKFEPIQWDIRFWISAFKAKDIVLYPTLMKARQIPDYEYHKDLAIWSLMQQYPVNLVQDRIDEAATFIRDEIASDPYRQYMGSNYGIFSLNKESPFTLEQFDEAVNRLKSIYSDRQALLTAVISNTDVAFKSEQISPNNQKITISVSGNSPVLIDIQSNFGKDAVAYKVYKGETKRLDTKEPIILYPGRRIHPGNISGKSGRQSNMTFGNKMLTASPLRYELIISTKETTPKIPKLSGRNAITGDLVTIPQTNALASDRSTASLHPWATPDQEAKKVVLSGTVEIAEDRIYEPFQQVNIEPGTTFKLAKGASIIFYGPVHANGTQNQPIRFERLNPEIPWGSIVIQGQEASNSILQHVIIKGGSTTHQRLIDYPGQLNIHDVAQFTIDYCHVSNNVIGDDSLHVAYSKGTISNCTFKNTAFDAIDIDIGEVIVSDSHFYNIGNDALDLMTSRVTAQGISVHSAGDKCISAGEVSNVNVLSSTLSGCQIGIAAKDGSEVELRDSQVNKNREAPIALYRKNPRYSIGGKVTLTNITGIDESEIQADSHSQYIYGLNTAENKVP